MEVFRNKMLNTIEQILNNANQIKEESQNVNQRKEFKLLSSKKTNSKTVHRRRISEIFGIEFKSPKMNMSSYLDHISNFKEISDQQLKIASYIFVKVLLTYGAYFSQADNYQFKLFAGSLLIAHKFLDDVAFDLESLEVITGVEVKDLHQIELLTLELYLDSGGTSHLSKLYTCWLEVKTLSIQLFKPNSLENDGMAAHMPRF